MTLMTSKSRETGSVREAAQLKERRKLAGQWLKAQRKALKLTQKDLAKQLALEYYTFISQIESGHGRVPSTLYVAWATALNIETASFARKMLEFYDPHIFNALGYEPTLLDDPETRGL